MALALPVQSQNTNSGISMEISVDENFRLPAHQPMFADRLNVPIPPGYHGSTTAGLPTQPHGLNLQNATHSQIIGSSSRIDYTGYDDVLLEGDSMMEDCQSIDLDMVKEWLADSPLCNDTVPKIPSFDNGFVRGNSRGVFGWFKIKVALRWGFLRKSGVRIEELDQPPIEVRACS
ncbi:hypothetical protein BT93_L0667 [Corymbia citriodora subsp. variegata]|uniref:Uncharacterized protein n=1 Tax=Corymbia citriodora subsp. variegata TaxID=360336 RepID=A0A8T0CPE1_CORYI|nr:hypothetical protein BT93_L0667 [Corymbia citriodora subsp. variegata]